MASFLFEMQSQHTSEMPGWRVAFTAEPPPRMGLIDESREMQISVPFPKDEQHRGENVYRALFAVLLERVRETGVKSVDC